MIFHRLGLINKNQRGFTLIEILIAIAITGIITGGITTSIFQVINGNTRTSNHMTAVRQVQNAGYWVSHDGQQAQSVVITGVSGFPLTLTWTDWESGDVHEVVYTLLVDNELQRRYTCVALGLDETGIMAQFIEPANCEFAAGSAFSLPDITDAFTIIAVAGDSGAVNVTDGSISVTVSGDASWADPYWTGGTGGGTIVVAATAASTRGNWTSTTGSATAAITLDGGEEDATLAAGGVLIFKITATVQKQNETRVYEVIRRPD